MDRSKAREELLPLSIDEITVYSSFNRDIRSVVEEPYFWSEKARRDLDISPERFRSTDKSPRERYVELSHRKNVTYGSERYEDLQMCLNRACAEGDISLVHYFVILGANDYNQALLEACKNGSKEVIDFLEERGANNWNWGLKSAVKSGNVELAKRYIEKGADNIAGALVAAVLSKQRYDYLLDKKIECYDDVMEAAAAMSDIKLVKYCIERGTKSVGSSYEAAKENGHIEICDYLKKCM